MEMIHGILSIIECLALQCGTSFVQRIMDLGVTESIDNLQVISTNWFLTNNRFNALLTLQYTCDNKDIQLEAEQLLEKLYQFVDQNG